MKIEKRQVFFFFFFFFFFFIHFFFLGEPGIDYFHFHFVNVNTVVSRLFILAVILQKRLQKRKLHC